jgi:transcriptional regulator with PAS, ATPase and Fis domain
LRRALLSHARTESLEVASLTHLTDASVRSLSLRSVFTVPIPVSLPARAALVLDSREPRLGERESLRDLLDTFAGLIAVALRLGAAGEVAALDPPGAEPGNAVEFVGDSTAFRRMANWMDKVATTDLSIVIQGESGTGKERVSREIHRRSRRHKGPFVAVNCTALPETLLEAELFGCRRGAYTGSDRDRPGLFRLANGGTLMLDEVGDMPKAMQAKLLRAIQERQVRPLGGSNEVDVDVRIVAASHRDLSRAVHDGAFRADLYFRLAVLVVDVPALRHRIDDLPLLIDDLTPRLRRETGMPSPNLTEAAREALRRYAWPGNIRELHSVLARAMIRAGSEPIDPRHLGLETEPLPRPDGAPSAIESERELIVCALARSEGSVAKASQRLGWSRQKLYRRMCVLDVARPPRSRSASRSAARRKPTQSERGTTSSESSTFQ